MRYRLLAVLSLGALILAGCAPSDPKSRFLRGDPCKPPCFEGIEPGETSLAEAKELLSDSTHVGADHAAIQMIDTFPLLDWSYPESEWVGRANGGLEADENAVVEGLSVLMPDVCLSEVITAYGEPDLLFLPAYHSIGWVVVIWEAERMLYSSNADDEPGGSIITEPCGGAVEFIAPDAPLTTFPSLVLFNGSSEAEIADMLVEWQGMDHDYGEFEMPITP